MTVAWSAPSGDAVRAFAAMSMDGGASFGPAQQIDPDRRAATSSIRGSPRPPAGGRRRLPVGSRRAPGIVSRDDRLRRAAAAGRDDRGLGQSRVVRPSAPSATLVRQPRRSARPRRRDAPVPIQPAAGDRRGLHGHVIGQPRTCTWSACSTARPRRSSPAPDGTGSKNVTTIVHVNASDADGDPLTWSAGAQPAKPALEREHRRRRARRFRVFGHRDDGRRRRRSVTCRSWWRSWDALPSGRDHRRRQCRGGGRPRARPGRPVTCW